MVYFNPCHSRSRASHSLNVGGAPAACFGSYTLMRMTLCGQTMVHLPHWMQMASSHTGISCAMLRFSHFAVPVGKVPSTGSALTGRLSPKPAIILAVTSCTNGGASGGTGGGTAMVLSARSGTAHFEQVRQRAVDGGEVHLHDLVTLAAVALLELLS